MLRRVSRFSRGRMIDMEQREQLLIKGVRILQTLTRFTLPTPSFLSLDGFLAA